LSLRLADLRFLTANMPIDVDKCILLTPLVPMNIKFSHWWISRWFLKSYLFLIYIFLIDIRIKFFQLFKMGNPLNLTIILFILATYKLIYRKF